LRSSSKARALILNFAELNSKARKVKFLGSVKTLTKSCSSNSSRWHITGIRPINSGIIPNFTKSSCFTLEIISESSLSSSLFEKPIILGRKGEENSPRIYPASWLYYIGINDLGKPLGDFIYTL